MVLHETSPINLKTEQEKLTGDGKKWPKEKEDKKTKEPTQPKEQ